MSDLFDGVKAPKEHRPAAQESQVSAPEAAPAAGKQAASGVPVSRLWWVVGPLVLVALAVALWSVSAWLLLVVAGAAVLGVVITAIARWWQRRGGRGTRTTRTRSWTSGPAGRGTGFARSPGFGGRSGGSGRRGTGRQLGAGTGRATRTGSRWNPFGRSKGGRDTGPNGKPASGQGASSGGRSGRGRRLRSLIGPGRRGGSAATGHSSGGTRQGRRGPGAKGTSGSGAGSVGGRWSRSRVNPATWLGPRRTAAKAERESWKAKRAKSRKKKQDADDKPEKTSGRKRHWWPWRRKQTGNVAEENTKPGDEKPAKDEKQPKKRKPKKTEPKEATTTSTDEKSKLTEPKAEAPKPAPVDDFEYDDGGFPIRPDPNWKPTPRPAPRQLNVDDGGFPSPVITTQPKPKPVKNPTSRRTTMSDRTTNPYVDQIDPSSTETFRRTTAEAAAAARRDAAQKEAEADDLLRQAAQWEAKGVDDAAESLKREAAALKETADQRRQAAAAYESV